MENTCQKNNNTHRNKDKKLNTNLASSISFYHWKVSLLFFFIPIKIQQHTHINKNKKLNTNLVSSIFFYHQKVSLLFFFIPIKIRWKHVLFETIQSHWRLISFKGLFLTFGNLTVIKYKKSLWWQIVNPRNMKSFLKKVVCFFNTGNGQYVCNNMV